MQDQPRHDFVRLVRDRRSGIEAVTAQFHGHAYDMHRHDEWLVGVTHAGVQDFFCRGERPQSTSGRVILIEPGERHDGQAVPAHGFSYSMLYLPQAWLREEIGGRDGDVGFRQTLTDDRHLGVAVAGACHALLGGAPRLSFDAACDEVVARLRRHFGQRSLHAPESGRARGRARDGLHPGPLRWSLRPGGACTRGRRG